MANNISINTGSGSNTLIIVKPQAKVTKANAVNFAVAQDVKSLLPDSSIKDIPKGSLQTVEQLDTVETKAMDNLQFRVKFIRIDPVGFTANTPAPVGFAIIGVNNYIL